MSEVIIPALITLGAIMILGFIGNYIFNKTQIPSIVWLLVFGLIVGLIFESYMAIISNLLPTIIKFFAAVAIVIILFDGGINSDLKQLFKGAPRGLLLVITGFSLTVITTMFIMLILSSTEVLQISLEKSIFLGIVLGAMIGGTSSPIVIPLASRLSNLEEKTKTILSIESIITDPLCIVVVLAAISMISPGGGIEMGVRNLVSTFSVGAVMGLVLGLVWLPIMHRVRKEEFSYVLTLAFIFLVYSLVEMLVQVSEGGSGAIACLVFGLVLGNGKKVLKMFEYNGERFEIDQRTRQFHSLTSFIIRTFFFVVLGMLVSFQDLKFILIGVLILVFLFIVRYFSVFTSTYKGNFEKDDKQTMAVMMPRGLAAAILAINFGPDIIESLDLPIEGFFKDTVFVIILGTAIICTIGVSIIYHYEKGKIKELTNKKQHEDKQEDL